MGTATVMGMATVTVAGTDGVAGRGENLLRLGLLFFEASDGADIRRLIAALREEGAAWSVVDDAPYDALLLARGSRLADPEHLAVLRISSAAARTERAMPPIMLRKPIEPANLRSALETARDRLARSE